jgi:NTE family protein
LVLSGGGMRGAYEVGVVAGMLEILGVGPMDPAPFGILAGTSVGAINAAYLAANAHRGDHDIERLQQVWRSLRLEQHARIRPFGLLRWPRRVRASLRSMLDIRGIGSSLLDTRRLERVVVGSLDFEQLHRNVDGGVVSALLIAALHVVSGRTTIFAELSPDNPFQPARGDRRVTRRGRIEADHVLASAAIPLLFPTRRVGDHYYCDGGLRFNTPIAPAIRAGADRIVVISVRHQRTAHEADAVEAHTVPEQGRDLSPIFLVGKLLNALLLDPVEYDLQVLDRLNRLMGVLQRTLDASELEAVQRVLIETRGVGYRRLRTLVLAPSIDLGRLASDYLRGSLASRKLNPLVRKLVERATRTDPGQEADWASYLLFDGGFAEQLIEIGRRDARDQAAEIREFFAAAPASMPPAKAPSLVPVALEGDDAEG